MTQTILSTHMWVSLPNEVRFKIRALFSIPRSSNTIVNDGRIETDGVTVDDFKHLTIEKMQSYLNTDVTDFHKLFDLVVAGVTDELSGKLQPDVITASSDSPMTIIIEPVSEPKRRGRPSKKNA